MPEARSPMARSPIAWTAWALIALFPLLALSSLLVSPRRADTLVSLSLVSVSLGFALIAFGYLRGQRAIIRFRALGFFVSVGGAIAGGLILFLTLRLGIRGTSNLTVELYADDAFQQLWRAPQGRAAPEFAASLESYTVVVRPDDFVVRLHNLPVFERVSFYSRDPAWNMSRLESTDRFCSANGVSLVGWCTGARAVITTNNCLDQWTGSGSVRGKSLGQAIDYFVEEMQKVHFPAKRISATSRETLQALGQELQPSTTAYNGLDFCTAINPYRVALEQRLRKPVKIMLTCDSIAVSIDREALTPPASTGWRNAC